MPLKKAYDLFFKILSPINRFMFYGALISLAIMMFLTAFDVIGRYFFNYPIIGGYEITEYLMVILVALSLGYCGIIKGHVEIELVIEHLPKRTQLILGCITSFLGMALFLVITWQTFIYIGDNIASSVSTATLQIPAWPFVLILAIGIGIFLLVLLLRFLEFLYMAVSK